MQLWPNVPLPPTLSKYLLVQDQTVFPTYQWTINIDCFKTINTYIKKSEEMGLDIFLVPFHSNILLWIAHRNFAIAQPPLVHNSAYNEYESILDPIQGS